MASVEDGIFPDFPSEYLEELRQKRMDEEADKEDQRKAESFLKKRKDVNQRRRLKALRKEDTKRMIGASPPKSRRRRKMTSAEEEQKRKEEKRQLENDTIDQLLERYKYKRVSDIFPMIERRFPNLVPLAKERIRKESADGNDGSTA